MPDDLLTLLNCFIDFAVEHWFGCRVTEPGYTGDIGATEIWLIDWLIRHRHPAITKQFTKHKTGYALHIPMFAQYRVSSSSASSTSFAPFTSITSILHYTKLSILIPNHIQTLPDYNACGTAQHPLVTGLHSVSQHSSSLYWRTSPRV